MNEKRDKTIDIIKGLGIICVVLGHCTSNLFVANFVNLFHMAIFIIASGYFFTTKYSNSFRSVFIFVGKKLKSLWVPYVVCNLVFLFMNNIFVKIHIYSTVPSIFGVHGYMDVKDIIKEMFIILFFFGGTELGGATWFLRALFFVSCFYCTMQFAIQKIVKDEKYQNIVQGIISFGYMFIGWKELFPIHTMNQLFSIYGLFWLGGIIRIFTEKILYPKLKNIHYFFLLIFAFLCLLILQNEVGTVSINGNEYSSPLFLVVVSVLGWFFLLSISVIIQNVKICRGILANYIKKLGENSLSVVLLHFLAFKIVNLIEIILYGHNMDMLSYFPVLNSEGVWVFAYLIVGVNAPVMLQQSHHIVIEKCRNKRWLSIWGKWKSRIR